MNGCLRILRWLPRIGRPAAAARVFLLWAGLTQPLWGQNGIVPPGETADLKARIQRWTAPGLDPALAKAVGPSAAEASAFLQQAESSNEQEKQFQQLTQSLPKKIAELRAAPQRPATLSPDPAPPPARAPLEDLEAAAGRMDSALEQVRREVAAAREAPRQAADRRRELSALLADLAARVVPARNTPLAPVAGEAPETAEARNAVRQASLLAASAQQSAATAELAWLDAAESSQYFTLMLEDAQRRLQALEAAETALSARIAEARSRSATSVLETAARNQAAAPEALKPLLEQVTRRATENQELVETLIPAAEARVRQFETGSRQWIETAQRTRQKLNRLGATGSVGVELRQQRQSLPSQASLQLQAAQRQQTLSDVEATRLGLEEELAAFSAPAPGISTAEADAHRAQRESLATLLQSYGRYYLTLVREEEAAQQMAAVVQAHRAFIHENILWIPSTLPVRKNSLTSVRHSLEWMGAGVAEPGFLQAWWQGLQRMPVLSGLWLILLIFLVLVRRVARRRLVALARLAAQPDPGFRPTAAAGFWTLTMALPWPALIQGLAFPWIHAPAATPHTMAWASSLQATALVLLGIELVRQPLRPHGLAVAHFGWPEPLVRDLRWKFRHLLAVFLPCALLGFTFWWSDETRHDPAERLCLMIALGASAWSLHRLWKTARSHAGLPPRGMVRLAWWAGHSLSVLVPLALAVLALRGYLYTAEALTRCLGLSLLAGAGFMGVRSLFFRWYELHRRHLRSTRARQLREAREATRAASAAAVATSENLPAGTGTSDLPSEMPAEAATGTGIDENGQEMRRLVDLILFVAAAAAAWAIWADVLPAAKSLASTGFDTAVPALSATAPTVSADRPASGSAAPQPASPLAVPGVSAEAGNGRNSATTSRTNWLSILLAGGAALLTILAAKRIPGALQFVLTSQMSLDAGALFALSSVTRYLILIAGIIFTLDLAGITWSSVQWLAAALTVGLGFGLQEIFANFFSGLIILAERPIRLGDIVTIDNITGSVSRIQIRATTIRLADGKDYVVPNKEFITGKLLNWTLTDTTTRQEIQVGLASTSDPVAALALLAKIAAAHPAVLKDPAPIVSFELLPESAFQLTLRFHVGTLEKRLPTLTDLNCAIVREFAAANLTMPTPQRDIHLRSMPPEWRLPLPPVPGS